MKDKDQKKDSSGMPTLKFNVMPDSDKLGTRGFKPPQLEVQPLPDTEPHEDLGKPQPPAPPKLTEQVEEHRRSEQPAAGRPGSRRKWVIVAVLLLLVVGGLAGAYFYWDSVVSDSQADQAPPAVSTSAPKDGDNDGLYDDEEDDYGTNPDNSDTDGDGLSDGDEVNVFGTSAFSPHSDSDIYADGEELANGYEPTISGDARLTAEQVQAIIDLYAEGSLFEPTTTTLLNGPFWKDKLTPPASETPVEDTQSQSDPAAVAGSQSGPRLTYTDSLYGYTLSLPGSWQRSGDSATNLVFIEQNSPIARYVQIQAFVGVGEDGQITGAGLLESEVKRLAAVAGSTGVTVKPGSLGGLSAWQLITESTRGSANGGGSLNSATLEYIADSSDASFIVSASCTGQGTASCLPDLQSFSATLEQGLQF